MNFYTKANKAFRILSFFIKTATDGLLFANIWVAFIAAVSVWGVLDWVDINNNEAQNYTYFVFFSTLASYNFHYWLPLGAAQAGARAEWQRTNGFFLPVAAIIGLTCAVYFFIRIYTLWGWILGLMISTFFYSAPKINCGLFAPLRGKVRAKTLYLSAHWWLITAFLPLWVWGRLDWSAVYWLIHRAIFIFIIAALFDYKDREIDAKNQLHNFFKSWSVDNFKLFLQILNFFSCIFILLSYLCHQDICALLSQLFPLALLQFIFIQKLNQPNERLYVGLLDALWAMGFGLYYVLTFSL